MAGEIINRLNVGQVVNVKLTDSAVTNGQNLVDAYNYAKTLTPNGAALSTSNRVSVIIQPGNYTLAATLTVNTEFVDLIGLGAQKLERGAIPAVIIDGNSLNVTANDVRVQGISVGSQSFTIGASLPLQRFEDCTSGNNSFGYFTIVSGTFTNCSSGGNSFGFGAAASGTFTNCSSSGSGFGSLGAASGTFTNCTSGSDSFGASSGAASGTFTNCSSGGNSFGYGTVASGTFINCTSGANSFGYASTASGTFTNCTSGNNSFAVGGTASGTFTNCTGGLDSFGKYVTASGKFYQCRLTSGTFQAVSGAGLMRNCIDGNNNIVNQ